MVSNFDHVTVVVRDVDAATRFFALLGFEESIRKVISGPVMEAYMGVPGIEAEHVTLQLEGSEPRQEVQLLHFLDPEVAVDQGSGTLTRTGFNHLCFRVDDIEATVEVLNANGVELLNEVMHFNTRKLVFFRGPEGITLELAEWVDE